MPQQRYRFRLPDGQSFDGVGLAKIRKAHSDAVITHRITHDAAGNPQREPFTGEQTQDDASEDQNKPVSDEGDENVSESISEPEDAPEPPKRAVAAPRTKKAG